MRHARFALVLTVVWAALAGAPAPLMAQTTTLPVPPLALTPEQLGTLPQRQAMLQFGNPPAPHSFEGPLLWDVLTASGTIDPARHADAARQTLILRGADGYVAILALGEIAPEFEGKPAILATRMDGTPLPAPRAVLPGDKRAGRSVRDVTAATIDTLPAGR